MPTVANPFPYYLPRENQGPSPNDVVRQQIDSIPDPINLTDEDKIMLDNLKNQYGAVFDKEYADKQTELSGGTPLSKMKMVPDNPPPLDLEKAAQIVQEPLTFGLGKIAPSLKPNLTREEQTQLEQTKEAHPIASTALSLAGGLANPVFAGASAVTAGLGKVVPFASKILEMGGPIGDAARIATRWGKAALDMFTTSISEGKRWDDALNDARKMIVTDQGTPGIVPAMEAVSGVVRPFSSFARENMPGLDVNGEKAGIGAAVVGRPMARSEELLRTANRAPSINEARGIQKQTVPDTNKFFGPEGDQAISNIEEAKNRSMSDLTDLQSQHEDQLDLIQKEGQDRISQAVKDGKAAIDTAKKEAAKSVIDQIPSKVLGPLQEGRSAIGDAYGTSAKALIGESGDVPINTEPLVAFIDDVQSSPVGIKDPSVLDTLASVKDELQGLPAGTSKSMSDLRSSGAKINEGSISGMEPNKEIPLSEYVRITRELKYPTSSSSSARFNRLFYNRAADVLRNQPEGSPGYAVSQKLSDLMTSYHDAITPIDDLMGRIETPSTGTETHAIESISGPEKSAKYEQLKGQIVSGAKNIEAKTGTTDIAAPVSGALSDLESTRAGYEKTVSEGEQTAEQLVKNTKENASTSTEIQKAKLQDIQARIKSYGDRIGAPPKTTQGILDKAMSGDLDTKNDAFLLEVAKKDPVVKEFLDKGRDWSVAKKQSRTLLQTIGPAFAAYFGRYRAVHEAVTPIFRQRLVLASPTIQKWIKQADAIGLGNNVAFQRITKGSWPLGLPAKIAIPQILQDEKKTKKLQQALSDEKTMNDVGANYLGGQ